MSLNLTIGANEVGILITTFINGITTAQLYTYHSRKFKDPVWVKFFAYAVWFIECAHTLILWLYLYRVTVTFYGVPAGIAASTWHLGASAVFNGIIQGMVQSYFAWKIWLISGKPYITFISWTGCATLLGFNAALCHVATRQNQTLPVVTHDYRWLIVCIGANILAVDILNTVSLSYLLWKKRNGIRSTDKMLEKLLVWTIETGLMTTISATIMLIAMVALANTAVWVAVSVFHAKFYSNSLFISLNRRELFRRDQRSLVMQTLPGSGGSKQKTSLHFASSMNPVESHHAPGISPHAMQVQISTETAVDNEYPSEGSLKEEKLGDQDHPYGRMV